MMRTYKNTIEQASKWASIEFNRLITVEALRRQCKSPAHTEPRWFVMAYMHATGRYSMPQIARALHLKDHTTILHGLRRAHGHDGKPSKRKNQIEPLWKKDQFVNMVRADFPELFAEEADWSFTNGEGWAA